MATDVTISLQSLHCNSTSDGAGQSPYIWPVLLWVDDTTLAKSDLLVDVIPPWLGGARVVIKSDMSVGQTADIPFPVGTLGVGFEDNLSIRRLILAVALWKEDETPEVAVWAGFKAFSSELRAALASSLFALAAANDGERQQIITNIKMRVKDSVTSAISNALTGWQKARVLVGTLNLDDFIASDFSFFSDPTPASFSLNFTDDSANSYTIQCVLQAETPPIDLCQAQVDHVKAAQGVVDGIDGQISSLQAQLQNATPQEKSGIIAQIKQLGNELPGAMAALDDARRALKACRDHWSQVSKLKVTGTTVRGT